MSLLAFAVSPQRLGIPDLEFWSPDRQFGLKIPEEKIALLLAVCAQSTPHETGGILIGFYTTARDCAVVTAISRAPSDSQRGKAYFVRGVRGLQRWINYLWRRKHHYYLGEWHFHPGGLPSSSPTDVTQMKNIEGGSLSVPRAHPRDHRRGRSGTVVGEGLCVSKKPRPHRAHEKQ